MPRKDLQERRATWDNPHGDLTMNDLELAARIVQLILTTRHVSPLQHIISDCDNIVASSSATRDRSVDRVPLPPCYSLKYNYFVNAN